ncbi:MAG TPA: TadE/TadG family type IV pilus assembly protein [Candidatus Dormibacteraeota bacterium]|nr:TadE/TadG family type IV pilus assembly protein [Candidatus Dormibacteraeota bacterium]
MRQRQGRHTRLGQAMVEMAIVAPVLVLLMLGAADLGRAFYLDIEVTGASRAGVRAAIIGQATDIGLAVRSEPNSAIPNDVPTWGDTGPGGTNDCDPNAPSHLCGDPSGCPPSVFSGTRIACFAERSCTLNNGSCTYGNWGTRPLSGPNAAVQVRAVYKMTPVTPAISALAGTTGGFFFLPADTTAQELY